MMIRVLEMMMGIVWMVSRVASMKVMYYQRRGMSSLLLWKTVSQQRVGHSLEYWIISRRRGWRAQPRD